MATGVLSERDALLLKLALERRLIAAEAYADLLEALPREAELGAAKLLRARGVGGKEVGLLVELATPAAGDARATLSRADAEHTLVVEALRKARLVPEQALVQAEARVREEARQGRFLAPTEALLGSGALGVAQAAALRRRARGLLATCPGCWRHYLLPGRERGRCTPCGREVQAGAGLSAVDAWRGLGEERPPGLEPGEGTRKFALTLPTPVRSARPAPSAPPAEDVPADAASETRGFAGDDDEVEEPRDPASATVSDSDVADEEEEAGEAPGPSPPPQPTAAQVEALMADWDASVAVAEEALAETGRTTYFGGYEVQGELARGGMGVVYRARRQATGEEVALKVLLGGAQASARQGARFEREADLARRLDHPGVVRFVEAGIEEGFRYLAVELVPGRDLEERVRDGGPLPWAQAAEVVAELADALEYVHQQGVIHRDLKPDNVILRPDGRPVLIDFGLARVLEARQLTESVSTIGTPAYMPPEQVTGKSRDAGPPADVYAMGAILHFLVAGQPPFTEEEQTVLYAQVVTRPPPPLRSLRPEVPRALERVVLRALAKDPARRQQTAGQLAAELRAALDPSTAESVPGAGTLVALALGLLVLVMILVLVWRL